MNTNYYKKAVFAGTEKQLHKIGRSRKKLLTALVVTALAVTGCSTASLENAGKEIQDTFGDLADSDNKYVKMVKGGYREDNPDLTYGEAFSDFFATPRWNYFESEDGENVVEFTGDCTYQDVAVKARIQFIVDEENGTFEMAYFALNEVPQNQLILAGLMANVFGYGEDAPEGKKDSDDNVLYSNEDADDTLFEKFSEFMVQNFDFSGMRDEEVQSYIKEVYEKWVSGEDYDAIAFDENLELMLQDVNDDMYLQKIIRNGHVPLENYVDFSLSLDDMGRMLQLAGTGFVMDDSGYYRSSDESVWIYNSDMGGPYFDITSSDDNLYSVFGVYCGMDVEDALETLLEHGAENVTTMPYYSSRMYVFTLSDSYTITLYFDYTIEQIEFDCFLWDSYD